jgi:hypothetical protein
VKRASVTSRSLFASFFLAPPPPFLFFWLWGICHGVSLKRGSVTWGVASRCRVAMLPLDDCMSHIFSNTMVAEGLIH